MNDDVLYKDYWATEMFVDKIYKFWEDNHNTLPDVLRTDIVYDIV
jgi:hypothetical protein